MIFSFVCVIFVIISFMQKLQKIDWMLFSVAPRGEQVRRGVPDTR